MSLAAVSEVTGFVGRYESRFRASGVMTALRTDGVLREYAKIVRDFTERRKLDDAVRGSQKLESVGVLAAGVAHDFDNAPTAN